MRILCATSSYPGHPAPWAGSFVQSGVRALESRGHRVTVIHLRRSAACTERRALAVGGRRESRLWTAPEGFPDRLERSPIAAAGAALGAARLCAAVARASRSHDVVLSHWVLPAGIAGAAARRRHGVPHVCVLHPGGLRLLGRLPFGGSVLGALVRGTDAFAAVADDVAETFLSLVPRDRRAEARRKVRVVPNALDGATVPAAAPSSTPTVAFLGRLVPVKGCDVLLDALRPGDGFEVVVGGDGPESAALRERAASRGLRVTFAGAVDPAARYRFLARARVVVVPSRVVPGGRTEGLPMSAVEALRAGRPVVASDTGALGEVVSDGVNGRLVPADDSAALRSALLDVLAWDGETTAPRCRDSARRFEPEAVAPRLEAILDSVVREAGR